MASASPTPSAPPRLKVAIAGLLAFLVAVQILFLSPGTLEQDGPPLGKASVDPNQLVQSLAGEGKPLAPDIPLDRIPDYTIDGFNYLSTKSGVKQWKLNATRAHLYNKEKLVHSRKVKAFLYDSGDTSSATEVIGDESRYFMNQRDLEIYGNVKTTFPDGFTLLSDYLRYQPKEGLILIPQKYPVRGTGEMEKGKSIDFTSMGMKYEMRRGWITLPENVVFNMLRPETARDTTKAAGEETSAVPEKTTILSDHCEINRSEKIAHFTMYPTRELSKRFVRILQPTLFVRGRRVDLNYGELPDALRYLIAYDDVYIRELEDPSAPKKTAVKPGAPPAQKPSLRYGTCGRADFDTKQNIIILTQFPQVYQDKDTVTGEVIIIHRDTDIVEVERSNAFSAGREE